MWKKATAGVLALFLVWGGWILPSVSAAPGIEVRSEQELRSAIQNGDPEILLAEDLVLNQTLDFSNYQGTLDGQNHTLSAGDGLNNMMLGSSGNVMIRNLTLDGAKHSRLLRLTNNANWWIEDSKLQNGSSVSDDSNAEGGSVYVLASTLKLTHTMLTGSVAKVHAADMPEESKPHGGAIYGNHAILSLDSCTVTDNLADNSKRPGHGGAIYLDNKSSLNIFGGTFSNNRFQNKAISTGAVVYASDETLVQVQKNTRGDKPKFVVQGPFNTGGAIRLLSAKAEISDAEFEIGSGNGDGYGTSAGAIMSEGSYLQVVRSTFRVGKTETGAFPNAKLDFAGGFIGVVGEIKKFQLDACAFTGRGQGNGLALATYGGAICFESSQDKDAYTYGVAEINNCTFSEITADQWGGIIALSTKAGEKDNVALTLNKTEMEKGATLVWGEQYGGGIAVGPGNTLVLDRKSFIQGCKASNGGNIYNQGSTTLKGGSGIYWGWGIHLGGGVYNDGMLRVEDATFIGNDAGRDANWKNNAHPFVKNNNKREHAGSGIYAHKDVILTPEAAFDKRRDQDIRVLDGESAVLLTGSLTDQVIVTVSEYEKQPAGKPDANNLPPINQGEPQYRKVGYVVAKGVEGYTVTNEDAKQLHYISYLDGGSEAQHQAFCDFEDHESIGKWDYLLNPEDKTIVLGQRVKLVYHANPNGVDDASQANFPNVENQPAVTEILKDVYKPVVSWTSIEAKPEPKRKGWNFVNWYNRAVKDADVQSDPQKDVMEKLLDEEGEITSIIDPNEIHTYAGWTEPEPETVTVSVEKKWAGLSEGDTTSESVSVNLLADGKSVNGKSLTLNAGNSWKGSFADLPKYKEDGKTEIQYSVSETEVEGFTAAVAGTMAEGFVITNTKVKAPDPEPEPKLETVTVSVEKKWAGLSEGETTPESVSVNLLADGRPVEGKSLTLNAGNNWKGSYADLPKYKEDGKTVIWYTVSEIEVKGFTAEVTGTMAKGFVITNTKVMTPDPEPEPKPPVPPTPDNPQVPPVDRTPYVGKWVPPTSEFSTPPMSKDKMPGKDAVPQTGEALAFPLATMLVLAGLALIFYPRKIRTATTKGEQ